MPGFFQRLCHMFRHYDPHDANDSCRAKMDRCKQRATSPLGTDSVDRPATAISLQSTPELANLVDGVPSRKNTKEERADEFWNSVLSEGDERAVGASTKSHSHHSHMAKKKMESKPTSEVAMEPKAESETKVAGHFPFSRFKDGDCSLPNASGSLEITNSNELASKSSESQSEARSMIPRGYLPRHDAVAQTTAAHPIDTDVAAPPPSPTGMTWNLAMNRILTSGYVDPAMMEAFEYRLEETDLVDRFEAGGAVDMVEIGLVPNFSRPVVGAPFYDRLAFLASQQSSPSTSRSVTPNHLANGPIHDLSDP